MFQRYHIPWAEIYFKKGPIAWIKFPDRQKIPFDLSGRMKNGYFLLYNNRIKGLFKVDPKYVYFMGKTPCYDYSAKNMNPIDEELVDELNKFLIRNKMTRLQQKDVKHSTLFKSLSMSLGRGVGKKANDPEKVKNAVAKRINSEGAALESVMEEGKEAMAQQLEQLNKEREKPIELGERDESFFILKFLRSKGVIDDEQHATFIYKVENGIIGFGELVDELRGMNMVSINEPLNEEVEGFVHDFGSQDPVAMAAHVDDLRQSKKGLHSMTPVPVKSFVPAGIVLAGGLLVIFAVILISNGTISFDGISSGMGGFKLPGMP